MAKIATFYDHIRDMARQEHLFMVDALQRARELSVEAVEASANNVVGREDEIGQELAMADLEISTIPSYFDFGRDTDVKRQALPLLEAAQYLGAPKLLVIPGFFGEGDSPQERENQTQRMLDCVCQLADLALDYGVSLTMEDYDDALSPIATAAGVRRFLNACPQLSSTFDTGNFLFAGEQVLDAYHLLRDRVDHVHLKDRATAPDYGPLVKTALDGSPLYPAPVGSGILPLEEIVAQLKADGYDGVYTLEFYGASSALECLWHSVEWLNSQRKDTGTLWLSLRPFCFSPAPF